MEFIKNMITNKLNVDTKEKYHNNSLPSNTNIITYSNRTDKLIYLKESEKLFNTEVKYIIDQKPWKGNVTKIIKMVDILKLYDDNDVIVFISPIHIILQHIKLLFEKKI